MRWGKGKCVEIGWVHKNGASEEIRTLDIHLGKVTLYQLSYTRIQMRREFLITVGSDCKCCFERNLEFFSL